MLETLKFVLGPIAHRARAEILLDSGRMRPSGSSDADTLALKGKRIVWASETNEGNKLNVGKVKELAGGDTLTARAPYGRRPVEFTPTHLLFLLTNAKPRINANDFAIWKRVKLIPFTLSFIDNPSKKNERKADKGLQDRLEAEASGILAWLVRGTLEWQEKGLNPPAVVETATTDYRKENDLISQFIDEKCLLAPHAKIKAGKFYEAYKSWCNEMGHAAFSGTRFGINAKELFEQGKDRDGLYYKGVGLLLEQER